MTRPDPQHVSLLISPDTQGAYAFAGQFLVATQRVQSIMHTRVNSSCETRILRATWPGIALTWSALQILY
jgi:hypothetical protein